MERSQAPSLDSSSGGEAVHSVRVVKEFKGIQDLCTSTLEKHFKIESGVCFTNKVLPDSGARCTVISKGMSLQDEDREAVRE